MWNRTKENLEILEGTARRLGGGEFLRKKDLLENIYILIGATGIAFVKMGSRAFTSVSLRYHIRCRNDNTDTLWRCRT